MTAPNPPEGIPQAGGDARADDRFVRVTEIGEYLRLHSCPRRFRLEVNRRRIARQLPFADRLFNTLET